jgi:CheY-like chemotaxis protein
MRELILVIERDEIIRSNLFDLLEFEDFNVISAKDTLVGLRLTKELKPDLIICDLDMPQFDGYEILEHLQGYSRIAQIGSLLLHLKQLQRAAPSSETR